MSKRTKNILSRLIMDNQTQPTFGDGKICYIELLSRIIQESAILYNQDFGLFQQ